MSEIVDANMCDFKELSRGIKKHIHTYTIIRSFLPWVNPLISVHLSHSSLNSNWIRNPRWSVIGHWSKSQILRFLEKPYLDYQIKVRLI